MGSSEIFNDKIKNISKKRKEFYNNYKNLSEKIDNNILLIEREMSILEDSLKENFENKINKFKKR